jgi:hypothetical protein
VGSDATQRLRIEGGWLYRTVLVEEGAFQQMETIIALCFVADYGTSPGGAHAKTAQRMLGETNIRTA